MFSTVVHSFDCLHVADNVTIHDCFDGFPKLDNCSHFWLLFLAHYLGHWEAKSGVCRDFLSIMTGHNMGPQGNNGVKGGKVVAHGHNCAKDPLVGREEDLPKSPLCNYLEPTKPTRETYVPCTPCLAPFFAGPSLNFISLGWQMCGCLRG